MSEEEIEKTMMEIGRKYSEQAMESDTAKKAEKAFSLASRAFTLALKAKKQQKPVVSDYTLAFLALIDDQIKRSLLWENYNRFCVENSCQPLNKGVLFAKLDYFGFSKRKQRGEFFITPPRNKPLLLTMATSQHSPPEDT